MWSHWGMRLYWMDACGLLCRIVVGIMASCIILSRIVSLHGGLSGVTLRWRSGCHFEKALVGWHRDSGFGIVPVGMTSAGQCHDGGLGIVLLVWL